MTINEGLITGIATVALAGATFIIAYLNYKLWIAQDRPHLYFYKKDSINSDKVDLYVVNIGKGAAIDVEFKVGADRFLQKYRVLPIEKDERLSDDYIDQFRKDNPPDTRISNIKFKDVNGTSYTQPDSTIQLSKYGDAAAVH